jgi:hypothetical protein
MKSWSYLGIVGLLLFGVGIAEAQNKPRPSSSDPAATSAGLIEATREYKANTESLLQLQREELNKATQKLEQLTQLVADGLIAKNELQAAEETVAALQATLEATRKKIGDSDQMIAEIQSEQIRKTQSVAQAGLINKPRSFVRPTVLRYNGAAHWSIAHLAGVQSFFSSTFGRSLPTSTVGQSTTHNRLGWDHRNSVDIPLHPDSVEGKTLISFLQNQGIPFLSFRGAIPGISTGAHIHIGRPSQRLS